MPFANTKKTFPKYNLSADNSRILHNDDDGPYRLRFNIYNNTAMSWAGMILQSKENGMNITVEEIIKELKFVVNSGMVEGCIREVIELAEKDRAKMKKPH